MWSVHWLADGEWDSIERDSVNGCLKTLFNLLYGASYMMVEDWYVIAPDGSNCTSVIRRRLRGGDANA